MAKRRSNSYFFVRTAIILVMAAVLVSVVSGYVNIGKKNGEEADLAEQIKAQKRINEELEDRLNADDDTRVIQFARDNGYGLPGEHVIIDITGN